MTTNVTSLRASPGVFRAVGLIAARRHLHLRLADSEPVPIGFVRSVPTLDLWTPTCARAPATVDDELERWLGAGVQFAIFDVASYGIERLIETIYFPLFVRFSYCLGTADFPVNLDTLRRLATPDVLLTLAQRDGVALAACLFQRSTRSPSEGYSAPELVRDGLDMAASATRDPAIADVFFYASLQMLEATGFGAVRRRKQPWVTHQTAAQWCADSSKAERLAWEETLPGDYFAWQPAALAQGEGILGFELAGGNLQPRRIGAPDPALVVVERRIDELLRQETMDPGVGRVG